MTRARRLAIALTVGATGAIALGGCGSGQTKTVSVSSASTPAATSTQSTAARTTAPTAKTTPSSTTRSGAAQSTTGAARTAPAPAFTKQAASAEGLSGALAVVKAHGFTANNASDYHSGQTLRVLVGTRSGSGDGYGQRAFFFVNGSYIGTDASEPSATIRVAGQSDTEVTLAYPLYRSHDPLCCPGGGQAKVRFQLNNGRLAPLDAIPPASSSSGLSRQ